MSEEQVMVSVFSLMIFAGVAVLWLAMSNRRALREMEHRERIALIQAGIVPAPEADPLAFETNVPGVFAAGDVRANANRRIAAAVGEGSAAIFSIHQYLRSV